MPGRGAGRASDGAIVIHLPSWSRCKPMKLRTVSFLFPFVAWEFRRESGVYSALR